MFGPLSRFDPHRADAAGKPQPDPDGRTVAYVGADLATSLCEVSGAARHAALCPRWRVAILAPTTPLRLFDLLAPGAAMRIGALPALADGPLPRALTQSWARALYEDQPARQHVTGIRYRSAYNGGPSLALWDAGSLLRTVLDAGSPADLALADPALRSRLLAQCTARRITTEFISSADCTECQKDTVPPLLSIRNRR